MENIKGLISELIRKHKITAAQFSKVKVISEAWLSKSILLEERQDITEYNLSNIFTFLTANDQSVYYSAEAKQIDL
jgi:hypothetical protein